MESEMKCKSEGVLLQGNQEVPFYFDYTTGHLVTSAIFPGESEEERQQRLLNACWMGRLGRLIDRITIDEGRIKVQFKSGVEIGDKM